MHQSLLFYSMQISVYSYLPHRILYGWSEIYSAQLNRGDDYDQLNPVISIWLLADNMIKHSDAYHHHFQLIYFKNNKNLSEHCSIHVLELNKWQHNSALSTEDQWLYFFKEARNWSELPLEVDTPTMRQAMDTLKRFSEKEKDYLLYLSREDNLRVQRTNQALLDRALE